MTEFKRVPLISSKMILKAYRHYDYFGLLVYGPLRCGKSSYVIQLLAEVYGILKNKDWKKMVRKPWDEWKKWALENTELKWDAWKERMVFEPKDFVHKVAEENIKQRPLLVWDDAGFWLSHYGYHHPFVKTVADYLNVAASDWSSLVFTTPNPKWVLTHVRRLPGGHTGRISKDTGDPGAWHLRYLRAYQGWIAPDMKKEGVRTVFQDNFRVVLPDKVFNEYDKVRRGYARRGKERMRETLHFIEEHWPDRKEKKQAEIEKGTGFEL